MAMQYIKEEVHIMKLHEVVNAGAAMRRLIGQEMRLKTAY